MSGLRQQRRAPASGLARNLVVFLHGYGANGDDLIGLGDVLAPHLPDTVFLAPDAPEPCQGNPMGYQWFPIPWLDGSSPEQMRVSLERSSGILLEWLAAAMAAEGLGAGQTTLFGFSQGTMMALHVGPQIVPALAGIAGFSGRLLDAARLGAAPSRPPVLLVHGDADQMVPFASMAEAESALTANGYQVMTHAARGEGHGISAEGLGLALQFIRSRQG